MRKYLTYDEAREFLKDKNIGSQRDYNKWIIGKSIEFKLPAGPRKFYKESWISWPDYLSNNKISNQNKKNMFYSYYECSKYVISCGVKSKSEYKKFYKTNCRLPSNPDKTYKEWVSWCDFLNKERRVFTDFISAKYFVHKLNLKSYKEWVKWCSNNNPNNIPVYPNIVYKEWISWMDWLNTDNVAKRNSNGTKIIEEYFTNLNIKYTKEKTFKNCKNINLLYFDFYLDDYNICIEYDGIQHYKPIDRFGGEIGFKSQKIRDDIKNKFCLNNSIKLIRIPYWEQTNIYILLENKLKEYGVI